MLMGVHEEMRAGFQTRVSKVIMANPNTNVSVAPESQRNSIHPQSQRNQISSGKNILTLGLSDFRPNPSGNLEGSNGEAVRFRFFWQPKQRMGCLVLHLGLGNVIVKVNDFLAKRGFQESSF